MTDNRREVAYNTDNYERGEIPRAVTTLVIYRCKRKDAGMMCSHLQDKIAISQDDNSCLQMIISYIIAFFPHQRETLLDCILRANYQYVESSYPTDLLFKDTAVELKYTHFLLAMLGMYLTIPFKNLTTLNYNSYFSARANAIMAIVGMTNSEAISRPCPGLRAISLSKKFSRMRAFRAQLIRILLNPINNDQLISLSNYILDLAEFTEMNAYLFIWKALILSASAILSYPDLHSEVSNYMIALQTVLSCDYPQYFRILGDPKDQSKVERSKFPVLVHLSQKILHLNSPSLKFIAKQSNVSENYITQLYEYHLKHTTSDNKRRTNYITELYEYHLKHTTSDNKRRTNIRSILDGGVDYNLLTSAKNRGFILREQSKGAQSEKEGTTSDNKRRITDMLSFIDVGVDYNLVQLAANKAFVLREQSKLAQSEKEGTTSDNKRRRTNIRSIQDVGWDYNLVKLAEDKAFILREQSKLAQSEKKGTTSDTKRRRTNIDYKLLTLAADEAFILREQSKWAQSEKEVHGENDE